MLKSMRVALSEDFSSQHEFSYSTEVINPGNSSKNFTISSEKVLYFKIKGENGKR